MYNTLGMARNADLDLSLNPAFVVVDELVFDVEDAGLNVGGGAGLGIFGEEEEGMLESFDFKDASCGSDLLPVLRFILCLFTGLFF